LVDINLGYIHSGLDDRVPKGQSQDAFWDPKHRLGADLRTTVRSLYERFGDPDNNADIALIFLVSSRTKVDNPTDPSIAALPRPKEHEDTRRDATQRNSTQRPLAASKHLRELRVDLTAMTKLTTAASIGIGDGEAEDSKRRS
jgi:hypothetical protein